MWCSASSGSGKSPLPAFLTWQIASALVRLSPYKDTNHIMRASFSWPHPNLISCQRLHFQIPSHWRLGVQHRNLGGHRHSVPNTLNVFSYLCSLYSNHLECFHFLSNRHHTFEPFFAHTRSSASPHFCSCPSFTAHFKCHCLFSSLLCSLTFEPQSHFAVSSLSMMVILIYSTVTCLSLFLHEMASSLRQGPCLDYLHIHHT